DLVSIVGADGGDGAARRREHEPPRRPYGRHHEIVVEPDRPRAAAALRIERDERTIFDEEDEPAAGRGRARRRGVDDPRSCAARELVRDELSAGERKVAVRRVECRRCGHRAIERQRPEGPDGPEGQRLVVRFAGGIGATGEREERREGKCTTTSCGPPLRHTVIIAFILQSPWPTRPSSFSISVLSTRS